MRTIVSVPLHTYSQLRLKLDHTDTPIVIDLAAVRWADNHDYGIEFLTVRPDQQDRLRRLIDLLHMKSALLGSPSHVY